MSGRQVTVDQGTFESAEIHAVVTRCGCADPMAHAVLQLPCPTPKGTELPGDNGLIAKLDESEIRAYTFEREPSLGELLRELGSVIWSRLTGGVKQ